MLLRSRAAIAVLALAFGAVVILGFFPPAAKVLEDWGEVRAYAQPILLVAAPVWLVLMLVRHVLRSGSADAFVEGER